MTKEKIEIFISIIVLISIFGNMKVGREHQEENEENKNDE